MRSKGSRLPREIWVLVVAAFVVAVGFGIVAPALPAFARSFDVGYTAVSAVISLFAGFRLAFAPLGGRLVGRFGELRIFGIGLTIAAASVGATAFAQSYVQLLLFRGLGGIGSTMFTVSAISLLIRLSPADQRGRASGVWATGFLLGNIAGPLVGGGLITVSLRAPFLVYAGALALAMAIALPLLRGRIGSPAGGEAAAAEVVTFGAAFRHPTYRAALTSSFANGWTVFGVRVALVPLFVVEALRLRDEWSGYALAVFAVGNAATLLLSGRLADRRGRRPPVLAGLAVSAVATGLIGVAPNTVLFLVLSLVAGVGSGLVNPSMTAAVADVIGSGARGGTVLAGFQMAADVGAIVGPLVAGAVAQVAGFGWAFALTGLISLLALAFWVRAPETLPRTDRADPTTETVAGERAVGAE
ncbi:MFS transporter [Pseudonocardia ailaonensis]|uniref:MFS transporter n=1 Tax=Pseudonocardia ailaonensis TaxID=367279 RepID=A0ABN2MZD5_9PSEU